MHVPNIRGIMIFSSLALLLIPASAAFAGTLPIADLDGALNGGFRRALIGGLIGGAAGLVWALAKKKPKGKDDENK